MPKVAHIQDGHVVNVTVENPDWIPPGDGSQMLVDDAVAANIPVLAVVETATSAAAFQVREFLIRNGVSLDSIPTLIASVTSEGTERDVALMRWEFVTSIPKEHPLVVAVAAQLHLNLDDIWASILSIE